MDTVSKWFIALVTVHVLFQLEKPTSASVAMETGGRRRPRNLLRQDFQPADLEFAPRWKFNISTVPKLYMKLQHESVTLKCDARGRPKPAVTWFKDGRPIVIDTHSNNPKYESIGVFSLRVLDLMSAFDRGNYTCIVTNRHGSINHTYAVDVVVRFVGAPQLTRGPTNQTAFEGETIQLGCGYYSDMEAFVYWKKQKLLHVGANATTQPQATILQRGDENGLDETEWIIPKAQPTDSGIYSCCATNVYGTSCRQATIRVNPGQRKTLKAEVPAETGSSLMITVFPVAVGICFLVLSGSIVLICFLRRRTSGGKITFKSPDVVNPIYLNLPQTSTHLTKGLQIPIDEKWMIPSEDLRVDALIGLGAFGMVYVGHWTQGTKAKQEPTQSQPGTKQSTLVAVKMLKDGSTEEDLRCFLKEIEIMKNIFACHINVIGFIGCCTQNGQLQMVFEFARYGNLRDFLKDRRNLPPASPRGFEPSTLRPGSSSAADDVISRRRQPPHEMLISFAFQAARGLEHLATKNVLHRDVACRNVLLADDLVVKIADFGLTRILDPDSAYYRRHTADLLPIRWMSPESLADNKYSMKSDVWSFGVLLWEIFSLADVPYESVPVENLLSILKNGSRLQKPSLATTDIYRTMFDCWQYLPQDRPTFTELVATLVTSLSQVAAADYLLLDDKTQSEETSIGSDEEVFDQTSESQTGQPERLLSASRSADSQHSSWSSDHTNSDASRVHLLPHRREITNRKGRRPDGGSAEHLELTRQLYSPGIQWP